MLYQRETGLKDTRLSVPDGNIRRLEVKYNILFHMSGIRANYFFEIFLYGFYI